ncbi:hypothetical protein EZJ43_07890 [Pedobacter changchengzhani]|uniref:DUF4369 domain-containing protein n=1 Tax=Pedobacter changchengzhani TaxID=2529274 RepID=A0A4R5ML80_9SPHI|nr:hypothetical protein [Pedobacter changchengzhani]TDG36431.1 hypothetical protein EZJ43_07890 [Pedobacter changchengzhani]
MKNRLNIQKIFFLVLLFMSASSFGQIQNSITVKIESGQTTKNYIGEKLESMIVEMYAMNYGNALTFTKVNDLILITNAQEPNTQIKIEFRDKFLVRNFLYDEKVISSIEAIAFDLNNLPKSSTITNQIVKGKIESHIGKMQFENTEGYRLDKSYKLFLRLTIPADLNDIDAVFDSVANFFSQEDALLRIFLGRYAEKTQPLMTGYLVTDKIGSIENGIIFTPTDDENGKYDIYHKGKIIKTQLQNLIDFQETIMEYFEKNITD